MNYNLYNRELQDGYIKNRIDQYRKAANFAPAIIKVLQAFNGKCFNCKLEKALQDETGEHITARKHWHNIVIEYYERGDTFTLASCKIEELIDGKRIDGDLLIKSATERRESHLKKAYELENAFNNMDDIMIKLNQLKQAFSGLMKDIPYEAQDVYRLKM